MISRRNLFWLLVPFCMVGGAALRAKEKIMASPAMPERWRGQQFVMYSWTDGTETWYNGHSVPPDAENVVMNIDWPTPGNTE